MAATKTPLAVGETVSFTAGRYTITLQRIRPDVWSVVVYQGDTLRIDDLCGSYDSEDMARVVARGYATLFLAEIDFSG